MKIIKLSSNILEENNLIAEENRKFFNKNNILAVNIMGTPGCGKTTLIEEIIKRLKYKLKIAVIEGDIATLKDARRIKELKVPVVQINTDKIGNACHLNSKMIKSALKSFNAKKIDLLIIENIGNLVCPAEFDLGENLKIVMTSISEGDDKIAKYPPMFANSDIIIINKLDIVPYFNYNFRTVEKDIKRINPKAKVFKISAKTQEVVRVVNFLADLITK